MTPPGSLTQRSFLASTTAAAPATAAGGLILPRPASANDRLNLAIIGVGGVGGTAVREMSNGPLQAMAAAHAAH